MINSTVPPVIVGLLFAGVVVSTGFGVLRGLRLAKGLVALGLSPAAGLGALVVLTVWGQFGGLPQPAAAFAVLAASSLGLMFVIRDRDEWWSGLAGGGEVRATFVLLAIALAVPVVVLGDAFAAISVPISSHDGAHHVEIINLLRQGGRWSGWYPLGFHAVTAAFLQLMPFVDTAEGVLGVGLGLAVLAPLGVFALGLAVLRNLPAAATASVLIGLTAQYPYHLQFWDGWPLGVGIILATGLWTAGAYYLERPDFGWAALGALLASATLFTHGTELYTAVIGLLFMLVAAWRRAKWAVMARHLPVALLLATGMVIPYVPALLDFYHGGGAVAAADVELAAMLTPVPELARMSGTIHLALDAVGAIVVDAPLRLGIVMVGVLWTFRLRTGRLLAPLGITFVGMALAFQASDIPVLNRMYALTFPWSQDYRLLMIAAICASLFGGAGLIAIARVAVRTHGRRWATPALLTVTVLAQITLALLEQRFSAESVHYLTYTADDAAAFDWLRQHIRPGEVVINDGSADAGIWTPYKAGASILLPRVLPVSNADERTLIRGRVADLDQNPQLLATVCGLGARYVYLGASGTLYEPREFPPIAILEQSEAMDEVFRQASAAVFRLRCSSI
jgi:uncharacterized protein DUF6541